ncbi:MAG TPA: hypothetical protein VNO50_07275 [Pyrinomonadaceae bacterium]|nr:hypothetical protein [Pyrinomonadaceae bacterium]
MSSVKCTECGMINWSTASVCKRCGTTLDVSESAAAPRPALTDSAYPRGRRAHEAKQGETIKPCKYCGKEVALTKWDSWNGFLVQCPHGGGLHGKRWNIRRVLLASFVFNAFSFLFTMRPPRALLALVVFIILAVLANYFLLDSEAIPDLLEIAVAGVLILGPMIINGIVLMVQERDLDDSAPPTQTLRQ